MPASPQQPSAPSQPTTQLDPLSQSKPSWLPYLHSGLSGLAHSLASPQTSPRLPSPPPGFGSGLLQGLQSDLTGHVTAAGAAATAAAALASAHPPQGPACHPAAVSLAPGSEAQSLGHNSIEAAGAGPSPSEPTSHPPSPMLSDLPAGLDLDVPWPAAVQTHVGEMDNQFVPTSFIQSLSPLPSPGHAAALAPALSHPGLHGGVRLWLLQAFLQPTPAQQARLASHGVQRASQWLEASAFKAQPSRHREMTSGIEVHLSTHGLLSTMIGASTTMRPLPTPACCLIALPLTHSLTHSLIPSFTYSLHGVGESLQPNHGHGAHHSCSNLSFLDPQPSPQYLPVPPHGPQAAASNRVRPSSAGAQGFSSRQSMQTAVRSPRSLGGNPQPGLGRAARAFQGYVHMAKTDELGHWSLW